MSEIFSGVGVFILIALTIINLVIYHTIFSVTYFGSLGRHFIREVITAWIVAVLEMALIGTILVKVFGVVSAVLTFLLKIIVIVLVIISVVYTCKTLKKAYHYKEEGIVSENKVARVLKRIWKQRVNGHPHMLSLANLVRAFIYIIFTMETLQS